MITVDEELYSSPGHAPELKAGRPAKTTPGRLRYLCAHGACRRFGQQGSDDFQESLNRAARMLSQMQQCCNMTAALHPQVTAAQASRSSTTALLATRLQIQALLALGATGWLWQHSSWQLLAQPHNHIASTCLKVINSLMPILHKHLLALDDLPASAQHVQVIRLAMDRLRLERAQWMHLQSCCAHWSKLPRSQALHALTQLRNLRSAVRKEAGSMHGFDFAATGAGACVPLSPPLSEREPSRPKPQHQPGARPEFH